MDATGLSQTAINVAVGGLVLTLTQTTKRWTPEGWGPIIAAVWTTLALVVWLLSQPDWPPARSTYFDILAVWVSIYATALGLYSAAMIPSNSRQSIGAGTATVNPEAPTIPTVDEIAKAVLRERALQLRERYPEGVDEPVAWLPPTSATVGAVVPDRAGEGRS